MMRLLAWIIIVLGAAAFCRAELTANSSTDVILDRLHEVGQDLKTFTAKVVLRETDLIAQDSSSRSGEAVYEKKANGDARMRITFTTRTQDAVTQQQQIDYLLDNGWLVDRNYARKLEVKRQMLKPGEKANLLKLGEGPFPLPIGQTREDVYKNFDVARVAAGKDDPANTTHILLTPKAGTRFERKFKTIDVWVDLASGMPRRVETVDPNDTMRKGADLLEFKSNVPVTDAQFAMPDVPADWQRREEAYND